MANTLIKTPQGHLTSVTVVAARGLLAYTYIYKFVTKAAWMCNLQIFVWFFGSLRRVDMNPLLWGRICAKFQSNSRTTSTAKVSSRIPPVLISIAAPPRSKSTGVDVMKTDKLTVNNSKLIHTHPKAFYLFSRARCDWVSKEIMLRDWRSLVRPVRAVLEPALA